MKILNPSEIRVYRCLALTCYCFFLLNACNAQSSKVAASEVAQPPGKNSAQISGGQRELTLNGFNYTNRYIDKYSVNGRGAGHLRVSGPNGGGGGSVCCFSYGEGFAPKTVTVKWQHGGCEYDIEGSSGKEVFQYTHSFFKSTTVEIEQPVPKDPQFLNVHFYPDGTVKVDISEVSLGPRLDLNESREDKSDYPRCPNGKKPPQ